MAYLRLGAIRQARSGKKSAGLLRGIDYIYNPEKTESKYVWGIVPYVQAMLLARYLRGDLDGYPPFLWK